MAQIQQTGNSTRTRLCALPETTCRESNVALNLSKTRKSNNPFCICNVTVTCFPALFDLARKIAAKFPTAMHAPLVYNEKFCKIALRHLKVTAQMHSLGSLCKFSLVALSRKTPLHRLANFTASFHKFACLS